jgi:hypothetical protein
LRVVLAADGLDRPLRGKSAQNRDGQLGADARDGNQPLEKPFFLAVEKAEEGNLVLGDLGVDVQG